MCTWSASSSSSFHFGNFRRLLLDTGQSIRAWMQFGHLSHWLAIRSFEEKKHSQKVALETCDSLLLAGVQSECWLCVWHSITPEMGPGCLNFQNVVQMLHSYSYWGTSFYSFSLLHPSHGCAVYFKMNPVDSGVTWMCTKCHQFGHLSVCKCTNLLHLNDSFYPLKLLNLSLAHTSLCPVSCNLHLHLHCFLTCQVCHWQIWIVNSIQLY